MKLGDIFAKEPVRDAHGIGRAWDIGADGVHAKAHVEAGLAAGTQVATALGWRNIEAVQQGDKVLTFDDGLQTVRRVDRHFISAGQGNACGGAPIMIPANALGNRDALQILPDQPVMVESDLGEQMFGDPFTLVPAHALIGFKGIAQAAPKDLFEVVTLHFDTAQVVFANAGALFYCPADEGADLLDMATESQCPGYEVLSSKKARRFVDAMKGEDAQDMAWAQASAENAPLHVVA